MPQKAKHYGVIIREKRKGNNLSLRQLASRAEMSEGHLRGIETGVRESKPATLIKLAQILGLNKKPLLVGWLKRNMPEISYEDIEKTLPRKGTIDELKKMYAIPAAEELLREIGTLDAGSASKLKAIQVLRLQQSLQNCIEYMRELQLT